MSQSTIVINQDVHIPHLQKYDQHRYEHLNCYIIINVSKTVTCHIHG